MKLFCLLLQVGCVAVCFGAEPASPAKPQAKEPVYRGKTLSQWATRAKDWDKQVRMEAITALGEMGPAASAALTEQIKDDDVFVRDAAIMALGKTGPGAIATLTGLFKANDNVGDGARRDACVPGHIRDSRARQVLPLPVDLVHPGCVEWIRL